jgi:hypothetical protein
MEPIARKEKAGPWQARLNLNRRLGCIAASSVQHRADSRTIAALSMHPSSDSKIWSLQCKLVTPLS